MKRVCVTGAGGYIGSWVVKLFLSKGYMVHGTVRDPCDETKTGHLKKLENAEERLSLFKADLLDFESLCAAFDGCSGVLHVASPVPLNVASTVSGLHVPNPQVEVLDPAILGTQNVLNACLKAKVKKIVVVSSGAAVLFNPELPSNIEADESCWTDVEYANATQNWYAVSKTRAEMEALNFAKQHELTVEGRSVGDMMENIRHPCTDVRDLSEAILLLYENPESSGRYICSAYSFWTKELVAKMKGLFPDYNYPQTFTERSGLPPLNSQKLFKLGWNYRPLEETIVDTIKNYEETGLLEKGKPFPTTIRF